jgi:tRNA threonylcarbamoyl adenosine modification protein (Sua5/YciO/YrdC/YwlC family)
MILRIDRNNPDKNRLNKVIDCLNNDGVIIYPTDTVYTLGGSIKSKKAYERICSIKKIDAKKANFSMVCYDLSHISDYTLNIDTPTFKLMKRTLPGPYTYILKANRNIPSYYGYNKKTIGIRVPNSNITREIVQQLGSPMFSASIRHDDSILEYMTQADDIYELYKNQVDIVIDGGACHNIASTIIDCSNESPELVREGLGDIPF